MNTIPQELIQHIAFFTHSTTGPPTTLIALHLTSRSIHNAINDDFLLARLFTVSFDLAAPLRRLGKVITHPTVLAREFVKRWSVIQRVKRRLLTVQHLKSDLWLLYLLLLEHDSRNLQQLYYAGVVSFLDRYFNIFLPNNLPDWPFETESTALALWILWLTTSRCIPIERDGIRDRFISIVRPFFVAAFRYQPFLIPDTHFYLPLTSTSDPSAFLYPFYRRRYSSAVPRLTHFGLELIITGPPASPAAILNTVARMETRGLAIPAGLPSRAQIEPGTEHDPVALGPTREDFEEAQAIRTRPAFPFADVDVEHSFENDYEWLRLTRCFNPWLDTKIKMRLFRPGMLHGEWEGRMICFEPVQYANLVHLTELGLFRQLPVEGQVQPETRVPPTSLSSLQYFQRPIYLTFREHLCMESTKNGDGLPIQCGGDGFGMDGQGDGISNAWFPEDADFVEDQTKGLLHVFDPEAGESAVYKTFVPGVHSSLRRGMGGLERFTSGPPPGTRVYVDGFSGEDTRMDTENESGPSGSGSTPQATYPVVSHPRPQYHTARDDRDEFYNPYHHSGDTPPPESEECKLYEAIFDGMRVTPSMSASSASGRGGHTQARCQCTLCEVGYGAVQAEQPGAGVESADSVGSEMDVDMESGEASTEEGEGEAEDADPKERADKDSSIAEEWQLGKVKDIVFTGETDVQHGRAWDFFRVYGRVRDADGLVVFVRVPTTPSPIGAGTFVFRGYIHSDQNFCGRWRMSTGSPHAMSTVEGSFVLSRKS